MNDIQDAYEQISYPHYVHPLTNPARLAAIGRLLGVPTADPGRARVLDIGCGAGVNLMAMADRLPGSHFQGIDFAGNEIAAGKELAAEAGLENVHLEQADLLTWEPYNGGFDYIVAYGVFSWVPDEVKDRLFEVCRQCLKPNGIACISYMTYPGSKQAEALRDLLRLRTEKSDTAAQKVAAAHQTLDFLGDAYSRMPNWPHTAYLRDEVLKIRQKESNFLLLDELGVERDPCYLMQFVNWAAEHELHYLGESEFHTMLLENLPEESARQLAQMGLNHIETEQVIDYVVNRSFRCSLLVSPDVCAEPRLNPESLKHLCLRPLLKPATEPNPDDSEGRFVTQAGTEINLRSVPLVAFCRALSKNPEAYIRFEVVCRSAESIAGRAFSEEENQRLCEDLMSLVVRRQIEVSAIPFAPPDELPSKPCLSRFNRALAKQHGMLSTAHHTACKLGTNEQSVCALLDGKRTVSEILALLAGRQAADSIERLLGLLTINGAIE